MTAKDNAKETFTRKKIRKALIKLGIKSHDDVFGIVPNMDSEKINALATVFTGYIRFLARDKEYMNNIIIDYPNDYPIDDSETVNIYAEHTPSTINHFQKYMKLVLNTIERFQDRPYTQDYIQEILNWDFSGFGDFSYGAYNLYNFTNHFIEVYMQENEISSHFAFLSNPPKGFFDKYLTTEDKNLIASKKKDRIAIYHYHSADTGVHLATVRRAFMLGQSIYLTYETENNGVLVISGISLSKDIKENPNTLAGLKKNGFVKNLPKNGEEYTDEEIKEIFEDVNKAIKQTNNQVYVLVSYIENTSYPGTKTQFIPDLENCSEVLDMPTPNGIRVNEFQSETERDEVARKLVNFMVYAQEHGENTIFAGIQYPSDQDGITFEDRCFLECFKTYGNEAKNANKAKATVEAYKAKVAESFFSLTNIDIAKETLAHMAKYRPGSYTLFEIANICGCYRTTSDKGGLWGCVHSCRFEHDFTPEYEASKVSAST